MQLIENWRVVLRKAWSSRLILLAAGLSGVEVVLPFLQSALPVGLFALASFLVTAAALVARLVAQPQLHDHESDDQKPNPR